MCLFLLLFWIMCVTSIFLPTSCRFTLYGYVSSLNVGLSVAAVFTYEVDYSYLCVMWTVALRRSIMYRLVYHTIMFILKAHVAKMAVCRKAGVASLPSSFPYNNSTILQVVTYSKIIYYFKISTLIIIFIDMLVANSLKINAQRMKIPVVNIVLLLLCSTCLPNRWFATYCSY